jgi:2-haloacid dehalogenase
LAAGDLGDYRDVARLGRKTRIGGKQCEIRWSISSGCGWSHRTQGRYMFPEVPEALARLQTRYPLVVLSNGDPDMLETAKRYHGIPFDHVISVAVANAFKPHVATYTKAGEIVGVRMEEVLFIPNHAFDCIGAKSAGMRMAFIDRRRRPFGITPHQPDLIVPSMTDLADALV